MRPRLLLLVALVAVIVPAPGKADVGVGRRVDAELRAGVHEIELTAYLQGTSVATSPGHLGVSTSPGRADIFWRRSDYRGDPWFESVDGTISAEIDDVAGTIRLRGSFEEFFHDGTTTSDITFRRAAGMPYADIYPPAGGGFDTWLVSGMRWGGMASGSIAGTLGSPSSLTGSGTSTLSVSTGVSPL